jgi:hypothetical protein
MDFVPQLRDEVDRFTFTLLFTCKSMLLFFIMNEICYSVMKWIPHIQKS